MIKKLKKEIKKMPKKIMAFIMIFAMLFSYFAPLTNVFAAASTTTLSVAFRDDNANYGKVQYSLDDGENWVDVTQNTSNINFSVSADNLRLKIVPSSDYSVDYAGIELRLDETRYSNLSEYGLESENGYIVPSNIESVVLEQVEFRFDDGGETSQPGGNNVTGKITLSLTGEDLEYNAPWSDDASDFVFGINNSEMKRLAKDDVNFIQQNNEIVGLETKTAIDYWYNYNDEGTVTFNIKTQWDDLITSLIINGVSYNTPQTKNALTNAFNTEFRGIRFDIDNVPYSENYNIEVVGRKQTDEEKIMGNFGWSYDPDSNEYSDDDKIPYGNLEFVKAVYDGVTYNSPEEVNAVGGVFEWKNAIKGTDPFGEAMFPTGTELTIKLIPDSGYQLTELTLNGFPFEAEDEPGVYSFTIGGGNWHLGAHFNEVSDEVQANSVNIKSGSIDIDTSNNEDFANGTAKLEVNDVASLSPSRMEEFENTATEKGYEIENYLDISLYNTIYKGGKKDSKGNYESWDKSVENIDESATITLELENDMNGKNLVIVHEKHNGSEITGYELIDATYNEENNTITFKTDSFSNYAIASKEVVKDKAYTVSDNNGNEISFNEENGHTYHLNIIDYLKFSDEDLANANISKEMYNQIIEELKNVTKDYGTLLAFYEIEVFNEDDYQVHEGPFNIKIKMTDDMKKYNTFKIMFIDVDNNLEYEDPITLSQDGEYLVGTLNHLSSYAVIGSNTSTSNNPQTSDNINIWSGMFIISFLGLSLGTYTVTKVKKSKIR